MRYLCATLLCLLPLLAVGGGNKKIPAASVSFHVQGQSNEGPKFVRRVRTVAGEHYFRKAPEVSTKDIVAFSPFPADDKTTYGIVFKLNKVAARRLHASTSMHRGKLLLALVNGQAVGVVKIDKPVSDGMLVIWSGVRADEIKKYDMLAPRIGEDPKKWKARLKKLKKENK